MKVVAEAAQLSSTSKSGSGEGRISMVCSRVEVQPFELMTSSVINVCPGQPSTGLETVHTLEGPYVFLEAFTHFESGAFASILPITNTCPYHPDMTLFEQAWVEVSLADSGTYVGTLNLDFDYPYQESFIYDELPWWLV